MSENKYQNAKIYKITSSQTNDVYIGSTCTFQLCDRLSGHKRHFRRYINGKYHYVTSFEVIQYDDAIIKLIEMFPCNNRNELHIRERYWIEKTHSCINKVIPTRSHKEYKEKNRDKILEQKKEYQKEYYKIVKDKMSDKILCEICCKTGTRGKISTHKKSKYHQKFVILNSQFTDTLNEYNKLF